MDKNMTYLHGNHSRIAPGKNIVPRYLTNTVTQGVSQPQEPPVLQDQTVEKAKDYVDEIHL